MKHLSPEVHMPAHTRPLPAAWRGLAPWPLLLILFWILQPGTAHAIPAFARQTGVNCVACHAGGQFPELTPFGRQFKLTGYTLGTRSDVPISAMAVASMAKVANRAKSDDPSADFQKNGDLIFATASLLGGGKITNNLGLFAQVTYDPYATQDDAGKFHGHSNADNISLRYADHAVTPTTDLIWGVTLNNNPSISDPWNTAPAWMQYVPVPSPSSYQFIDGNSPYPGLAAGGNLAGVTLYGFWNQHVFAELGAYGSANGAMRIMSAGVPKADNTQLRGLNPYWRLAYEQSWGDHHLMLGTTGMLARVYDDPLDTSDPANTHRFRDLGLDVQYQYLGDPHTVTAQLVYTSNRHRYPDTQAGQAVAFVDSTGNALPVTNATDTTHLLRGKLSYVYQATYGGSLSLFRLSGTTNTATLSSGFDPDTLSITTDPNAAAPSLRVNGNLSGNPGTRGWTTEAFWIPEEHWRIGAQYTAYSRFNGLGSNYDGFGRNAKDNNSLFVYAWVAY
jgi:hypothetical protein